MAYFLFAGVIIGGFVYYNNSNNNNNNNNTFKNRAYSIGIFEENNDQKFQHIIGKTKEGVDAYENIYENTPKSDAHPNYIYFSNSVHKTPQTIYTGQKWECVEFVRRFLITTRGIVFKNVDHAIDIWKINYFYDLHSNQVIPVHHFTKYTFHFPQKGDLILWKPDLPEKENDPLYKKYGHVAIVTDIDRQGIKIAEQNWEDKPWPGNYSRIIDMNDIMKNDTDIIGWIRV